MVSTPWAKRATEPRESERLAESQREERIMRRRGCGAPSCERARHAKDFSGRPATRRRGQPSTSRRGGYSFASRAVLANPRGPECMTPIPNGNLKSLRHRLEDAWHENPTARKLRRFGRVLGRRL